MAFYSGDAKLYDDRRIVIHIPEEKGSSKIVRYKLEERMMSINNSHNIYTLAAFQAPRPLIIEPKKKPAKPNPVTSNAKAINST